MECERMESFMSNLGRLHTHTQTHTLPHRNKQTCHTTGLVEQYSYDNNKQPNSIQRLTSKKQEDHIIVFSAAQIRETAHIAADESLNLFWLSIEPEIINRSV